MRLDILGGAVLLEPGRARAPEGLEIRARGKQERGSAPQCAGSEGRQRWSFFEIGRRPVFLCPLAYPKKRS